MSSFSASSKSNYTRTTSGRVKQRIEQLENVTTKPIPITRSKNNNNNFDNRKRLSIIASSNTPTVTPSTSITPRKRTKSKMEIFDDVYEQLEQLDELYFENMSIDDTISSSPVIQFDDTLESVPNLHVRMNSLMSRHEYETKRELICQQYYNAECDDDLIIDHTSNDRVVESTSRINQYLDPNSSKFSYLELQNKFPKGVKESEKEKYLTDEEFFTVFGMERNQFQSLGEYKRRRLKIDKGLF